MTDFGALRGYMTRLVVEKGVVDERVVTGRAMSMAHRTGLCETREAMRETAMAVRLLLERLRNEVRLPGESIQAVTLRDVCERRRAEGALYL